MNIAEITQASKSKTAAPGAQTRIISVWTASDGSETLAQGTAAAIEYVKALPTPVGVKQVISVRQSNVFAAPLVADNAEEAVA